MPDYVEGDEYVAEHKWRAMDEGRGSHMISWAAFVAFAAFTLLYALFGGRGLLALCIFCGVSWVVVAMEGIRLKQLFFAGSIENRLRIIEGRTESIAERQRASSIN